MRDRLEERKKFLRLKVKDLLLLKSLQMILLVKYLEKNIQVEYEVWEMELAYPKYLVHSTHDFVALLLPLILVS